MKPAAYILTVLMLFLVGQPLLVECQAKQQRSEETSCNAGGCCHKKNKPAENKDCDRSTGCNPFASCSQCQYMAVSRFFYPGNTIQIVNIKIPTASENLEPGFISDCWHPPEYRQS